MVGLLVIGSLGSGGCGAQGTPPRPSGSPAALSEPEARRIPVARALREDPPLPGVAAEGWDGLHAPAGASASGTSDEHPHHHHQHGAPPAGAPP